MDTLEQLLSSTQQSPGIVIFKHTMQVRWISQRARDMIARTGETAAVGWMRTENLPLEIVDLAAIMLEDLEATIATRAWAHVEARRTVRVGGVRFQLKGFGFPGLDEFTNFHLVVLISEAEPAGSRLEDELGLVTQAAR